MSCLVLMLLAADPTNVTELRAVLAEEQQRLTALKREIDGGLVARRHRMDRLDTELRAALEELPTSEDRARVNAVKVVPPAAAAVKPAAPVAQSAADAPAAAGEAGELQTRIAETRRRIAELEVVMAEVEKIDAKTRLIEAKLAYLNQLRAKRR